MARRFFFSLVVFLFAQFSAFAQELNDDIVGTVQEVEGAVTIISAGGISAVAVVDSEVHLSDTIETGPSSRAFILMIDDTQWTLSENTKLKVDEYVYDADDVSGNKERYSILEGAFLYVSGLIAKKPDPDVVVETPVGSMGIRGTQFWGGDVDGAYGVLVQEGRVAVRNDGGEVLLNKGEGTSIRGRAIAPDRAKMWAQEKIDKVVKTVHLQRAEQVKQRVANMKERQVKMRTQFKERLQHRKENMMDRQDRRKPELRGQFNEKRGDVQRSLPQRQEQRQNMRDMKQNNMQSQKQLGQPRPMQQRRLER